MKSALTRSQANELLRAAGMLPLGRRDQFITEVDNRLRNGRRQLTDADVSAAITSTLTVFNTTSCFMCDAAEGTSAMAKKKWEILDRNGNRVEDDDGVLQDGQRLRSLMYDSAQREVVEHFARLRADDAAKRFGLNDTLDLHKPGQRFCTDQTANDAREEVYQDEKRKLQQAWRTPAGGGQQPGDQCTINGAPGHLNHRLECIPDRSQDSAPRGPVYDAVEGQRVKDEAYRAMVNELTTAWQRKPVGVRR